MLSSWTIFGLGFLAGFWVAGVVACVRGYLEYRAALKENEDG